ncbi:AAA domain-containing protein [Pseudomonas sp. PA-6-1D]|nr:AAA domain-containing protein [Pseudomonas sp. PA-6-3C]MCF5149098.1 AAA domain-containing protein [Pseudomonas sp. PA-6-3F]MCF5160974.1 AAA domain-containing protein [Pseudomonas sp. PA-6-2E]MCF5176166.1 AAA domain-containing protein [Pseudomonas sp. PA-6-1D]MCF5195057.1 AAA domain-containing protein [Pseudomonas sp. PA-6-1H]MCF8972223.1 AAA domain-containing protein [Pseudomonas edaphica]
MMNVDLQQLIRTLTPQTRVDLARAAERCVTRGGKEVLVEDLLLTLLEHPDGPLARALADAEIAPGELQAMLQLKGEHSASRSPVFAPALVQWLQQALMVGHLELGQVEVDAGALLLALLRHPLQHAGSGYQQLLSRLDAQRVLDFLLSQGSGTGPLRPGESLLERFTHDLTHQAREGRIDPVLCRDAEIRQLIDILVRRRKNNPILVGDAGVGKTAIVEGLALRVVASQVPEPLKGVRILTLDMGLLQAGASIKGEFERRLKGVIDEVNASPQAVILFIDEAHTLVGAGGQVGGGDAANLLKPALARGQLRTIAATTWSEYKKYIEKDPALARRFQPVKVGEPSVAAAVSILRGLVPVYEASHGVYVRDDAVVAAAQLSARYLAGRQLPDKAVDVLDTACAQVRISLTAAPEALQQLCAELAESTQQRVALERDVQAGLSVDQPALQTLVRRLDALELERQQAEQGWMQREQQQASHEVCPRVVAQVISGWTGIPVEQLALEHSERIPGFADALRERIIGQEPAVQALDRNLRAVAAGLNNPEAPVGVFLLAGPSGVGKTETALALADLLYGGERFVITLNMSEYQEQHSLSRLIGAPPGYIGYGEGGVLTEAVRQRPYSVVLLDEVEKADPEVLNLFYQVFDKGLANDGEGREIDFRNTLILMTSNLGSDCITALCADGQRPDSEVLEEVIRPVLRAHFKPALLARMRVVPYYPLAGERLQDVARLKLARLGQRLHTRELVFSYSAELVTHMVERCMHQDSGARYIDQWIESHLLPQIVDRLLSAMAVGESLSATHATLDGRGVPVCEFSQ